MGVITVFDFRIALGPQFFIIGLHETHFVTNGSIEFLKNAVGSVVMFLSGKNQEEKEEKEKEN